MVTIALKRVENPLDFGVVVMDDEGRIERFLEKPTWGQVFSDTVNTGIYVLDPAVFDHIPETAPFDFSQDLFPKLLTWGHPSTAMSPRDTGRTSAAFAQYLAANRDLLDGKVEAAIPGIELSTRDLPRRGHQLDSLENMTGPAIIGNTRKTPAGPSALLGPGQQRGRQGSRRDVAPRHRLPTPTSAHGPSPGAILGKTAT